MERRIKSGRDCIRRALKLYVDVDGADIRGAFRDAITDVFHLMDEANSKGLVVLPNALYADHGLRIGGVEDLRRRKGTGREREGGTHTETKACTAHPGSAGVRLQPHAVGIQTERGNR